MFWDKFGDFFNEISWEWLIELRVGVRSFDFERIGSTGSSDEFDLWIGIGDFWGFIWDELSVDSFKHKIEIILFLFQWDQ